MLRFFEEEVLAAATQSLRRGERLFTQGESTSDFTFVRRGRVKLLKADEEGEACIVAVPSGGEIVCGGAVCSGRPYCCSAEAMEDGTQVTRLPRAAVLALVERGGPPALAVLKELSARTMLLCEQISTLSAKTVQRRLARLLLRLADGSGIPLEGGKMRVPVPLSRRELAALVGTSIETAIRVMSRMNKDGIVRQASRGFVIEDMKRLRDAARTSARAG